MAEDDGDGWAGCGCGERHWGVHGAAGLVLVRGDGARPLVLLQLRAPGSHLGGTWGVPGGARDSHESAQEAALREAAEEIGLAADAVTVLDTWTGLDHPGWSYTYVVATIDHEPRWRVQESETADLRWVGTDATPDLPLHPGLAPAWDELCRRVARVRWRGPGR